MICGVWCGCTVSPPLGGSVRLKRYLVKAKQTFIEQRKYYDSVLQLNTWTVDINRTHVKMIRNKKVTIQNVYASFIQHLLHNKHKKITGSIKAQFTEKLQGCLKCLLWCHQDNPSPLSALHLHIAQSSVFSCSKLLWNSDLLIQAESVEKKKKKGVRCYEIIISQ